MQSSISVADKLCRADAEQLVESIHAGIEQAKDGLYRLWMGGWKLLCDGEGQAYSSFNAMLAERFKGRSASYLYRLKDIRVIELELSEVSPNGESLSLKDAQVRELKKLTTLEARVDALSIARDLASVEGAEDLVTRHVAVAVQQVQQKDRIEQSIHHVIRHLLAEGKLSLDVAGQAVTELDKLKPQLQYDVQVMISEAGGLRDAALIPELAKMIQRKGTDDESLVLQWIEETGDVFGVALKDASMSDLRKAKYEAGMVKTARQKRLEREELEALGLPVVEEISCTIYKGDPVKTHQALKSLLGEGYGELRDLFVNEWLSGA